MLPRKSPPKHRHDGGSPLPLGMDWSPPPKKWNGRDTIWPHDPRSGWSYCVTIPSWIFQPEPGSLDDNLKNHVVFYRVQIGMQSPEGITSACVVLRRFSDFLKLFSNLKRAFPKKNIPQPPPKHALLRMSSSRMLLEERRYALEEWTAKLLSDIDLSRSLYVASFLELEAAARSFFLDVNKQSLEPRSNGNSMATSSSVHIQASLGSSVVGSPLVPSATQSIASDYSSDNAYEASEPTARQELYHNSETGVHGGIHLSQEISLQSKQKLERFSVCENGLPALGFNLDQPEDLSGSKVLSSKDKFRGLAVETVDFTPEVDHEKSLHSRKISSESVGSDMSSVRGSELSNSFVYNSLGDTFADLPERETPGTTEAPCSEYMQFLNNDQVMFPLDQRHKLNRVLVTMQRRLVTARTDMDDLISRLNQEMAVKEYLTIKVKDLEVELESTIQRSKENLQQAIMSERERITQMQWDIDELRRKSLDMESKLKLEENERVRMDNEKESAIVEREALIQELEIKREKTEKLQNYMEDMETKSKSDIKVLSKEVKSLRHSQAELKERLNQSLKEKSEVQRAFQKEKQRWEQANLARKKLLHECGVLRHRLQECSVDILTEEEDKFTVDPSSLSDAFDLLNTSDNRIGLLLAEAQLLAREDEHGINNVGRTYGSKLSGDAPTTSGDDHYAADNEVRKMLTDTFIDHARLRKQVNSIIRCVLDTVNKPGKEDEDGTLRKIVLNKFLER